MQTFLIVAGCVWFSGALLFIGALCFAARRSEPESAADATGGFLIPLDQVEAAAKQERGSSQAAEFPAQIFSAASPEFTRG